MVGVVPSHWLYALPLATFALLPVYLAAPVTLVLLVLVLSSAQWLVNLPDRHQMVSAFVLTTLLAGILVFLREYKSRQLAPLRRTDELTQAASREYLSADLHKEIQRSEREGTNLSVMMIGLDTHLSDSDPDEDIRAILPRIGRYLHSQFGTSIPITGWPTCNSWRFCRAQIPPKPQRRQTSSARDLIN